MVARSDATTKSLIICKPSLYEMAIGMINNNAVKQMAVLPLCFNSSC